MGWDCPHCGNDHALCKCDGDTYELADIKEALMKTNKLLKALIKAVKNLKPKEQSDQ